MNIRRFKDIIEEVLVDNSVPNVEGLSEDLTTRLNDEFSLFEDEEEEEDEF